ncbi:MAG: class I SAM-dependent methyltransferase [Leptospiraceae bacterium]|nr:class I SAM-dependent methyltransferase [Leptospiraceae bacterium]
MKIETYAANGVEFESQYWSEMYANDDESIIDGVVNAREHALYLKAILTLQDIEVNSLGDFGFGLGVLLKAIVPIFPITKIVAIDPSLYSVNKLIQSRWAKEQNIAIHHASLPEFHSEYLYKHPLDLSICNSVLQYVPDKKVEECFLKLSKMTKYLYFCVPTSADYQMMKEEINFMDPYAYSRPKEFYRKLFGKFFRVVSHNLLESIETVPRTKFIFDLFRY